VSQLQGILVAVCSQSGRFGRPSQGKILNRNFPAGAPIVSFPPVKGLTSKLNQVVCFSDPPKQEVPTGGNSVWLQPCPQMLELNAGLGLCLPKVI
jgi:hypothetical protein